MIRLVGVSKSYLGQSCVLDQIHLELKKGEFLYVVGESGAGKSSLLRLLSTEESPTTGKVYLFGYDVSQVPPTPLRAIRQLLGYIPQDIRLIPDLTVVDNIALSISLAGKRALAVKVKNQIDSLLEKLGLITKKNVFASTLSGGEAQRVAIVRALVRNPELIIADEPTEAQDRDYTWSVMELFLKSNQQGATVVLATHNRETVRKIRKNCAVLKGGQLTLEESRCLY